MRTPVIDAQVHVYERNHPGRPWVDALAGPPEVTAEDQVAAMDAVGVDGALLVSVHLMYRYDASYAIEAHRRFPGRFGLIKPVDAADPAVAEVIADWAALPGTVAVRLMMRDDVSRDPADPGIGRILSAAGRQGMPVNLLAYGRLGQVADLAARYPDTQIVVDHLGISQPFHPPLQPDPWADLPAVLALAQAPNVAIKLTGACTLSAQGAPFDDIWGPVGRIIDAYGIGRCLWGTDWTRAVALLTYAQGVAAFRDNPRFSAEERAALMGGNAQRLYRWSPA
ncbi:hypothetical protein EOD42_04165 [Rhodovarius crocodyli]|uniref:Amidohydrolase-related domain-containing protein n=1 Tax=Rhodovarius crocodyli TaxID=1979269 RepID=A0A437MNT2_9PROT|nr:amidohydrolase family protein [Rhodovarius crocodyli]RVT99299.1 hypothetical protein EOD42_04165 [Rhodovarius crocodyli]